MSDDLFLAILAMDAYNRGYNAGVTMTGGQPVGRNSVAYSAILLLCSVGYGFA
jgi:hypothetical protein